MLYTTEAMVKITKILSQIGFAPMLESLPAFTRFFVCGVILMGVDQDVIPLAALAPDAEYNRYQILRMVANGNPDQLEALTDLALDEIQLGLEKAARTSWATQNDLAGKP